ncbi:MAG: SusC/RagA family TonB-linked outer membrane protein [Dysgonomonas sp.]|nr:SusC/RagA family TonB-linked outer membrane protein [Dysgonomonas sp.]
MNKGNHVKQSKVPKLRELAFLSKICLALTMFLFCSVLYAQTGGKITVSGVVTDQSGETLIGASVAEKGTTNAVMTGLDGDYKLIVSPNAILVVTYVGFDPKEVQVNGQTTLNIVVSEDTQLLDEVVVTALGIKRDKKSLGYALSEVKGEDLTQTRDANIANSLSGKVAGLQIKQSGTGPAGSSRIVLRGNNSIMGNNQPLVVVDGVPIDSGTGGTDDYWGNRSTDRGSGMADISPDDIESISVLKGPAAAALYGSRAGNGVIMITTKTGQGKKGIGVSYNTNLTFDSPMQLPKYQNVYGQGADGIYNKNSKFSWGAKMEGQEYVNYVGKKITYSPYDNDLKDFIRTGNTWTNSVELTSATDKNTFRVGVMNLSNKGVVPNSDFSRTSATLRGTAKLTSKLSLDAKITYINQKTNNRIKLGGDPDNIFNNFLMMPRSVHMSDFSLGENGYRFLDGQVNPYGYAKGTSSEKTADLSGRPVSWVDPDGGNILNPYWAVYNNTNNERKNRFIGFASLKYEFTDWLNIQGRYGMDYTSAQYKDILFQRSPYWEGQQGLTLSKDEYYELNTDFLVTVNKKFDRFGLLATGGGNIMYRRSENMWAQTMGLAVENFYTLQNGLDVLIRNDLTRKQINSLYATASLSWDDMFYLDLTARNDWSSSLNSDNRSYFYPSVGASWLFTESLERWESKPSFLDYGKLRLSWAQVGNDADPYQLYNWRTVNVDHKTGNLTTTKGDVDALYDLKNETINSWEIGLELKALNNRIGLDFAFYNKEAKDQILKMNVTETTGTYYKYVNAGNIRNRGVELMLTGTPVLTKDFQWDIALNWSKNSNKILELAPGAESQDLGHASYASMVRIYANEGGTYGDLWGSTLKRDDQGNLLLTDKGMPIKVSALSKLGNANPDWMGGITNTFRYKGFDLSFQIDMRYGGDVYMGSIRTGTNSGTLEKSLHGREGFVVDGIIESTGQRNTQEVKAENYWGTMASITEPWIYDATNIRLRELSVGYTLPRKVLSNTPIQSAKISFVGRNLWMIHSKTDGFDPESGFSTGNAQGFEFGSMPTLRSLGFNVNVTF